MVKQNEKSNHLDRLKAAISNTFIWEEPITSGLCTSSLFFFIFFFNFFFKKKAKRAFREGSSSSPKI